MSVRVRFAPSPTGQVHIGNIRAAIFNWLFARHTDGRFLLRIEDTDRERSTPEAVQAVLQAMTWLGLDWDEEPVYQSTQLPQHQAAVARLLQDGRAYRGRKGDDPASGEVVLFRMPGTDMTFHDEIKGTLVKKAEDLKDFVIVRSDGSPVFHLANVVDDITMGITHVIRGDDHIENTYRHVAIFQALGATVPNYAHLPMIVNAQGKPYSKRDGAAFVGDFREQGFLAEALFNYLSLLGWSPGQDLEKMSRAEAVALFTLDHVKSGPAQMDLRKLTHLNSLYLSEMPPAAFIQTVRAYAATRVPWVAEADAELFDRVAGLMQSRTTLLANVDAWRYFFDDQPPQDAAAVEKTLRKPGVRESLARVRDGLAALPTLTAAAVETVLRAAETAGGLAANKLNQPVRVAVTGVTIGASIYDIIVLLGASRTRARLDRAIAEISDSSSTPTPPGASPSTLHPLPPRHRGGYEEFSDFPTSDLRPPASDSSGISTPPNEPAATDFIRDIVKADLQSGKHSAIVTRFPPEPNGYLHIGHAKSICLNFGIAQEFGGRCHLRMDDTNPAKEEQEYVESILNDVRWIGFDWGPHLYYASDYYGQLYNYAVELIRRGKAYVCALTPDEFKAYRGAPPAPGRESPSRNRPIAENLDLFTRMQAGEFDEGRYVLRAKIDMTSPNLHLRDPVIYRIKKEAHHRTGNRWRVYPMYDFAHCLSDSIEGITHSICTLEFEVHRPLYDWILEALDVYRPRQIEFARLNVTYTVLSKRKLLELVQGGLVRGWDDPRLPTIAGLRRRGVTPASIRAFARRVGVTKFDGYSDLALLEFCIREELNKSAPRRMAVLDPVKLVVENYPAGQVEWFEAVNNPEDPAAGTRRVPFGRELYIESEDFQEQPSKKFFRLAPGQEVRLRYAYLVRGTGLVRDSATGRVTEIHCTYDPATRGGNTPDGRKVKSTLHWVSAAHAQPCEVRLYDRLFKAEHPEDVPEGVDYKTNLNPDSLKLVQAQVEPALATAAKETRVQFERKGYFFVDPLESRDGAPVFNRIVTLKDAWAKLAKPGA